jgi:TRAP-type C4-dicarboxylate transport system substrate-binding protein
MPRNRTNAEERRQEHREDDMTSHRWVAIVAATFLAATAAQAADYRLTIAFDKTNPATPLIGEAFAKHIESASQGRMKVQVSGPETVPSFEQLQPVVAGVFDFGLTTGGYHAGTITAATVLDGMKADSLAKLRSSGMIDEVDKHYQRIGLKIIAVPYLPSNGYQMITREPVNANGDLKGRKLRGTPQYRPLLVALGAAEVVMPNAETYTALEKGVVDGACWTSIGILSAKFYEVNKYLIRPTFGPSHLLVLMNLNRWKALSAEERKVVEEAGRAVEASWATNYPRMAAEEEATLIKDHGMKISRMRDDVAARANAIMAEGTWALASGRNARLVGELKTFAKSKGLVD